MVYCCFRDGTQVPAFFLTQERIKCIRESSDAPAREVRARTPGANNENCLLHGGL